MPRKNFYTTTALVATLALGFPHMSLAQSSSADASGGQIKLQTVLMPSLPLALPGPRLRLGLIQPVMLIPLQRLRQAVVPVLGPMHMHPQV